MDFEDTSGWIKEPLEMFLIEHFFYRGVPESLWKFWKNKEKISPNIFKTDDCIGGLSTDWSKYCSPEDTKQKRKSFNENTGVIQFNIGTFYEINEREKFHLTLEHDPIREPTADYPFTNRGHSLIHGITKRSFKTVVQRELTEICTWVESCKPEKLKKKN